MHNATLSMVPAGPALSTPCMYLVRMVQASPSPRTTKAVFYACSDAICTGFCHPLKPLHVCLVRAPPPAYNARSDACSDARLPPPPQAPTSCFRRFAILDNLPCTTVRSDASSARFPCSWACGRCRDEEGGGRGGVIVWEGREHPVPGGPVAGPSGTTEAECK